MNSNSEVACHHLQVVVCGIYEYLEPVSAGLKEMQEGFSLIETIAMNVKMEELNRLGRFLVRDRFQRGDQIYVEGSFSPALESWQGWCRLYSLTNVQDVHADILWEATDNSSSILCYPMDWDFDDVSIGNTLYCGTLDLEPLLLILDLDTKWSERIFRAKDAWACEKDAKNVTLIPKGWDHEHCCFTFCWARISEHENTRAYIGISCYGSERWVCQNCYKSNVLTHRLPNQLTVVR